MSKREKPGLPSVHEARQQRERGRWARATPNLWLGILVGLAAVLFGYRFFSMRSLEDDKSKLLSKQRAVVQTVGGEWFPLRDKLEKFVVDSSGEWPGDWTDSTAGSWDFRAVPGIYLRLRLADAKSVDAIRKAAPEAQKDAFVGCLLREPNVAAARGEVDAGAFAEQPWNLRQAYRATRILTDDWVNEVKDASDDLRLRVFDEQYTKAVDTEIPVAIDLVKRAQFFLLVLDEDAPAAAALADGGSVTSEVLQLVPHDARVRVLNLKSGTEVARIRRTAAGGVYGEHGDPETRDAIRRQVNNCALAMQVATVLKFDKPPPAAP